MINNILKKIEKANEVQKVELAKHEVDLALADDVKNLLNELNIILNKVNPDAVKWYEKAKTAHEETKKIVSDAEGITRNSIRQNKDIIDESLKVFNKIELAAKDLGLNVKDIPNYAQAQKLKSEIVKSQLVISGYNDLLKKWL